MVKRRDGTGPSEWRGDSTGELCSQLGGKRTENRVEETNWIKIKEAWGRFRARSLRWGGQVWGSGQVGERRFQCWPGAGRKGKIRGKATTKKWYPSELLRPTPD